MRVEKASIPETRLSDSRFSSGLVLAFDRVHEQIANLPFASDLSWIRTPMWKEPTRRLVMSNPERHPGIPNWHNVPEEEFFLYPRAFRAAVEKMALAVELDPGATTKFAACPVVFMYRHALELRLKALILGEGGNFLATKPDRLSVSKTQSMSWLSQFVCQIVTTLKWEKELTCEGIE